MIQIQFLAAHISAHNYIRGLNFHPFCPPVVKAFQEYSEPEEANSSSPQRRAPTAGEDEAVVLPLGENTLTHNLGIPVLVVCTKASKYSQSMLSISYW